MCVNFIKHKKLKSDTFVGLISMYFIGNVEWLKLLFLSNHYSLKLLSLKSIFYKECVPRLLSRPVRRADRVPFPSNCSNRCKTIARRVARYASDRRVLPGVVRRNRIRSPFGRHHSLVDHAYDTRTGSSSINLIRIQFVAFVAYV